MAFYQATSGMWTPFQRVAFDHLIDRSDIPGDGFSVIAPYTGTYLIATGLKISLPFNNTETIVRGSFLVPGTGDEYFISGYVIKYVEKDHVIYFARAEQSQSYRLYRPCYCIYYLSGKELARDDVEYLGCVSNSNTMTYPSYIGWEPSTDSSKWQKAERGGTFELSGAVINNISITDPNKEYLISIIGGSGVNGGYNVGNPDSYASGITAIRVPETDKDHNESYIYYDYSDRQATGLVVGFYKFTKPVSNFSVGLGTGTGEGHLLKVTI